MRDRIIRFMQGRYGVDNLTRFLMFFGLAVMLISYFFGFVPTYYVSLVIIVYAYYRAFSRNISARRRENEKYLEFVSKLKGGFKRGGAQTRTSEPGVRIFTCPSCGQKVRVPSGKGKIQITCPKCHVKFIKKT
ncbi:MAG: hypothetical protein ILP10_06485 [Lachnospiraceae bacterium]|nr:hypothetical protein [Lachnospiraceae bacterium]